MTGTWINLVKHFKAQQLDFWNLKASWAWGYVFMLAQVVRLCHRDACRSISCGWSSVEEYSPLPNSAITSTSAITWKWILCSLDAFVNLPPVHFLIPSPQSLSCHLKHTCGSYETKERCLMSERGQGHLPGTNSSKTLWGSVTSCSTIRQSPEVQFLKSTN